MRDMGKRKVFIFLGVVLIVLLIGIGVTKGLSGDDKEKASIEEQNDFLPTREVIPTIDESVIVNLTSQNKKEVILIVRSLPSGTSSVEYELSYLAKGDLPKGAIGTIPIEKENSIERKITLGTCSSGRCVYDEGVKSVKVSLKFVGNYGNRLFEKEFTI